MLNVLPTVESTVQVLNQALTIQSTPRFPKLEVRSSKRGIRTSQIAPRLPITDYEHEHEHEHELRYQPPVPSSQDFKTPGLRNRSKFDVLPKTQDPRLKTLSLPGIPILTLFCLDQKLCPGLGGFLRFSRNLTRRPQQAFENQEHDDKETHPQGQIHHQIGKIKLIKEQPIVHAYHGRNQSGSQICNNEGSNSDPKTSFHLTPPGMLSVNTKTALRPRSLRHREDLISNVYVELDFVKGDLLSRSRATLSIFEGMGQVQTTHVLVLADY